MSKNVSLGAYGIMYVIKNKRSQVVALLLKNGVVAPSNASDMQVGLLVTNLLKVSKSFYNEFSALLVNKDVIYGMSANMSGSYANAGGFIAPDLTFNDNPFPQYGTSTTSTTSTPTTPPKEETKSTPSWINQGLGLLQDGFKGYLQLDDNKTKRLLADASVKISADDVTTKTDVPTTSSLSTGAIVGISLLGVTVVGLVVYLIAKKK